MTRRSLLALAVAAAVTSCTNQPFTLDVPLRVVSSTPSAGATGAARKLADGSPAPIVIAFSEELDPATVTAAAVQLAPVEGDGSSGPAIEAAAPTFAVADDGRFLITLVPSARLAYSQEYRVTLATSLRRKRDGGRLPVTTKWTFTTENPPPLAVVFAKPSDLATGVDGAVSRTPVLKVRFSEPVDCASVSSSTAPVVEAYDPHPHARTGDASRAVPGTWRCTAVPAGDANRLEGTSCQADTDPEDPASFCVLTFQPADAPPLFGWSSNVTLTLRGGTAAQHPLQSLRATAHGGQLPATVNERFRVVDPAPLAVVGNAPAAGSSGVARDASIAVQFSETVDCAQLLASVTVVEERDFHPHVPAPQQLAAGTARTRQLWPAVGAAAGGTWQCPAAGAPTVARFTPSADPAGANGAGADDGKALAYSSKVTVRLKGGTYPDHAAAPAARVTESARATTWGGTLPADFSFSFRTEDPSALAVTGEAPAAGSTGVARDTAIAVQFSEAVDCAQLLASVAVLEERDAHPHVPIPQQLAIQVAVGTPKTRQLWPAVAGGSPGGAWQCPAPGAPTTARFVPAPDPAGANSAGADDGKALAYSSLVTVRLRGGAYADHAAAPAARVTESARATTWGGTLPGEVTFSFRTEDPPPLRLVHSAPGDGASGVLRADTAIDLTFDQPLDCALPLATGATVVETFDALVAARVSSTGSGVIPGAASGCAGAAFTWKPQSAALAWQYSSYVAVALAAGAYGTTPFESAIATSRGGQLAGGGAPVALAFTTEDPPPLLLASVSPSPSAVGVERAAPLVLGFSRDVDAATLDRLAIGVAQAAVGRVDGTTVPAAAVPAASRAASGAAGLTWTPAVDGAGNAYNLSAVVTATLSSPLAAATGLLAADATTRGGWLVLGSSGTRSVSFRAQDPAPLSIAFTQPSGGGNAAPDASILIVFSRPIACGTVVAPAAPASAITAADVAAVPPNPAPVWTGTCTSSDTLHQDRGTVVLTLTGGALPRPLEPIKVTIPAGIAAADATVLPGGALAGLTPAAGDFTWSTEFVPLAVLSSSPTQGTIGWPSGSPLRVTFSAAVNASSFSACNAIPQPGQPGAPTPGCNFLLQDVTGAPAVVADVSASAGSSAAEVVFTPSSTLAFGHAYTLTLFGGLYTYTPGGSPNPITVARIPSQNGGSFLPQDFPLSFNVSTNQVIAATLPAASATNVALSAPICLTFGGAPDAATVTPANIVITYASAQGTLVLPWSGTSPGASPNTLCLGVALESVLNFLGVERTLLYGATYTVSIAAGVNLITPVAWSGYSFSFQTLATPPQLDGSLPASYRNDYVAPTRLSGAADVPLNSTFTVKLAAGAWIPSSVTGTSSASSTVWLVQGNPPFAAAPTRVATKVVSVTNGSFLVAPDAAGAAPNALAFDQPYSLVLRGGAAGLRLDAGQGATWIDDTVVIPFRTSKQTTALAGPYDAQIFSATSVPLVFSRNISLPTATSGAFDARYTLSTTSTPTVLAGFVGEYAPVPWAVDFFTQPTWPNNQSFNTTGGIVSAAVTLLPGAVLDEVGNPVAGVTSTFWTSTGNLSSYASHQPSGITATSPACLLATTGATASPACNTGTPGVLGDQPLLLAWPGGSFDDRMQPTTLSDNTVQLTSTCGTSTAQIPLVTTFASGCTLGAGCPASPTPLVTTQAFDQAVFVPKDAVGTAAHRLLRAASGCTYALRVRQTGVTNLFSLSGGTDRTFALQGLTATPTLAGARAVDLAPAGGGGTGSTALPGGTTTIPSGRSAISADLVITAVGTANALDTIAPESVTGAGVTCTASSGSCPTGVLSAKGNTLTFTPDAGQIFRQGVTYTLTFKSGGAGAKDLAGNPLGADTVLLFRPATLTLTASGAAYLAKSDPRYPNGAFRVTFSKPMRAESFVQPTASTTGGVTTVTAGTFSVSSGGTPLLGSVTVDGADPRQVIFQPTGPTGAVIAAGTYAVSVGTAATDLSGNPLGAAFSANVNVVTP